MSHRLFSSLVVSSTLLLEGGLTGCGGADSTSSSARNETAGSEESTAATSTSATEIPASPATNATPTETASAATTPPVTMASCEGGWHTTKAGPRCEVDTSGVTVCCPSWEVSAENRATECCIQPDAAQ